MGTNKDLENRAATAVAYALGARAIPRDLGGVQMRDFDLRFQDRPDEPLEITRHADSVTMQSWARLERTDREAPSLSRDWAVDVPSRVVGPSGKPEPFDRDRFFREAEPALSTLERAGYERFDLGLWVRDPAIEPALQLLVALGCNFGFSSEPPEGEVARIHPGAPVGGEVGGDLVAKAVEEEAAKVDNQKKLREPAGAQRRHLFVVVDGSTGAAFSAVSHGLTGRLPLLPDPITTAWVASSSSVYVTTPPGDWEDPDTAGGVRASRALDRRVERRPPPPQPAPHHPARHTNLVPPSDRGELNAYFGSQPATERLPIPLARMS